MCNIVKLFFRRQILNFNLIQNNLAENAKLRGEQLKRGLLELQKKYSIIGDVRGIGLMIGAEFVHADKTPAAKELDEVLEVLKDNGFIIGKGGVGRNVMAFQPPLVITEKNVDDVLNALDLVLSQKNFSH